MTREVRVWFDAEGDYLEVLFSKQPGFLRETANDAIMERVNSEGEILGFTIMKVSELAKGAPLVADLVATSS